MLDTLAYLLEHATDDPQRDLFVELTLTVPVRLTNLLPHLSYLMKPLVHALSAGPDLISQGLRTLELCIDNLTADFLDPTMGPVLRDLMSALHHLLRPIPANRNHAHAAVKILGKLGGRNRRFQEVENDLDYQTTTSDLVAPVSFEGKGHRLLLSPLVTTACTAVREENKTNREDGLRILILSALTVFQEVRCTFTILADHRTCLPLREMRRFKKPCLGYSWLVTSPASRTKLSNSSAASVAECSPSNSAGRTVRNQA